MAGLIDFIPRALLARTVEAAEAGQLPDPALRWAMRRLCASRARSEALEGTRADEFARRMASARIAEHTATANQQHYEVPTEFFRQVLGPQQKYSACLFESPDTTLEDAERAMLALTCDRAGIEDGMSILDLGCGWGSFTTYVAERYPRCRIMAVSNSSTQRSWIQARCNEPDWAAVEVRTADAAEFDPGRECFDRVVSVEMFEHMRSWGPLFDRIARALVPNGRFFMHVFCHRAHPYLFEDEGEADWMARNFFSGGIMPSFDLPRAIEGGLSLEAEWRVGGLHYARTLRAWLDRLDARRDSIEALFAKDLAPAEARRAVQRWRMFFMACEELFAFDGGEEWLVGHYLLRPRAGAGAAA